VTSMSNSLSDKSGSGRLGYAIEDIERRRADLEEQRKELAMLIKQTASEIDRVSQRAREAASQLRQVEANLDGFSHTDIKRAYSTAQEAQMRQFMMQNQLEQLRNRQNSLDSVDELLRKLMDAASELSEAAEEQPEAGSRPAPASAAEQLAQSHAAAQTVFRSIELAQHRVSRQLQDETAQTLSDLILRAEVCERLVEMDRQKAKTEVIRLKQAAAAALKSTRHLVQELRSPALDESGVATALRRYVETLRAKDKLQLDMQTTGVERRLPRPAEIAVFRIVQEALANAAKHSGATRVEIRVRYEREQLVVTVADDGSGFDVEGALRQARDRDESGLTDMQLRADLVEGLLEINSKPGSGCMVGLTVPV
jgi:two-component system sensor histidine kinase DegS